VFSSLTDADAFKFRLLTVRNGATLVGDLKISKIRITQT
jgi:hypothetical protein